MENKEILKVLEAFDNGDKLEFEVSSKHWRQQDFSYKREILEAIANGWRLRVKGKPKVIELFTSFMGRNTMLTDTSEMQTTGDTHKITYILDEENKPVLDSFKMEEL